MWRIENPSIRKATFNFSSSGQGRREFSQVLSGDVILMNAVELTAWRSDRTQLLVCDHCGTEGCASGGWVNFRKAGDRIFLIPAFDEIEQDDWSRTEYGPPGYLKKEGTPYFDLKDYESLVVSDLVFPPVEEIVPLEMREVVRLAQLEMPFRIFGEPPDIGLAKDRAKTVVAASDGDPVAHLSTIEHLLRTYYQSRERAELRNRRGDEEVIYLFIDADEFTDWEALVRSKSRELLLLAEELVIEPEAADV